jgi:hypothetical protein
VAPAADGDLQIVVTGETHRRDHVSGPDASGNQSRVSVDGTVPDCAGEVVVGVVGADEPASEPIDHVCALRGHGGRAAGNETASE